MKLLIIHTYTIDVWFLKCTPYSPYEDNTDVYYYGACVMCIDAPEAFVMCNPSLYRPSTIDWCMVQTILFLPSTWWSIPPSYTGAFLVISVQSSLACEVFRLLGVSISDACILSYNHIIIGSPKFSHTHPLTHTHSAGLITADERDALNELYEYNPLLFDLACKRLLKSPKGNRFPVSVFKEHPLLPPVRKTPFNTGTSVDPGNVVLYSQTSI